MVVVCEEREPIKNHEKSIFFKEIESRINKIWYEYFEKWLSKIEKVGS